MVVASQSHAPLCFYGDDFTGATAHLAGFHDAGLRTLMFLDTPRPDDLAPHLGCIDVLGVAGIARALAPDAQAREVRPALELFAELGARQVHYKVCSTFDSAPDVGSIGLALEFGREIYACGPVPIVVGCPGFGRYTMFGNHFARAGAEVVRLDRHPMARHPSTPMREADLRRHLAAQTASPLELIDIFALRAGDSSLAAAWDRLARAGCAGVVFDTLEDSDLDRIAAFLCTHAETAGKPVYSIAAQGLAESTGRWMAARRDGEASGLAATRQVPGDVDRMLVLSGSAAAQNAEQVRRARAAGWTCLRVDVPRLLEHGIDALLAPMQAAVDDALRTNGQVLVFTAEGPDDAAIGQATVSREALGVSAEDMSESIGILFARLASEALRVHGLRRLVLAGGDTSSHAMRNFDAYALEIAAKGVGGGRLCRLRSRNPAIDGVEVMLKGGQVGGPDALVTAASASAWRP
ncbi:four-carbon acid sugar kinase family protein [Variovorax sp. Root411]|uniref:four-carbon acid sugar kinase family protein n=1 Tax=Variovorax sp. Root411 TaxID=1736530 RepID=UPI0006F617A8|nr:four-carbon acid sugar kinase family protein [Variovorax sp. Root411]KQW56422.1 hypothetical protein ASC92_15970 [Variovorax sp. Root411]